MSHALRALTAAITLSFGLPSAAQILSPAPGNREGSETFRNAVLLRSSADEKRLLFPCQMAPSAELLSYYQSVGRIELRDREQAAIAREPARACRKGLNLYLNLAEDRLMKLFDDVAMFGWVHSFEGFWPEMDAHIVRGAAMFTDHIARYVIQNRDGRLFAFEGEAIRSQSGRAALFWGSGLTGFAGLVFLDGGAIKSYEPARPWDPECRYDALGSDPKWLDDETIEFAPELSAGPSPRILLRRSIDGGWKWEC